MNYPWHQTLFSHFKELLGQDQIAHAYLFVERSDFYDEEILIHISKTILCDSGSGADNCKHCQLIDSQTHPNLVELNCKEKVSINDIRLVENQAWQTSHFTKPKVINLRFIDYLSVNAQNALLKLLEEPPKDTYFVLSAEQKGNVLQTIISRTHYLNQPKVNNSDVLDWLVTRESNTEIAPEQLEDLACTGHYRPQKILSLLDDPNQLKEIQQDKQFFVSFLSGKINAYDLVDRIPKESLLGYMERYIGYVEAVIENLFQKKLEQDDISSVKWRGLDLKHLFLLRNILIDTCLLDKSNVNLNLQAKKQLMVWQDDRRK